MEENSSSILVVDDNPEIREIIQVLLGGEGYLVETAGNGVKALEMLENRLYDLSILDIMMPGMDGFGVLNYMNRHHYLEDIPVIMISSEDSTEVVRRAYEMGVTDYINRPYDA